MDKTDLTSGILSIIGAFMVLITALVIAPSAAYELRDVAKLMVKGPEG